PIIVENDAPAIRPCHPAAEKPFEPQLARCESPNTGAIQSGNAPRSFDSREGVQSLREPQSSIGPMRDRVDQLVSIANAEAAEVNTAFVRAAVTIRVAEVENLIEIADEQTACSRFNALNHGQPFGKPR